MGCTGIHPDMRYTESLQLDSYPDLPIPCPSRVGSGHREPRSGAPVCLGSTCVCGGSGRRGSVCSAGMGTRQVITIMIIKSPQNNDVFSSTVPEEKLRATQTSSKRRIEKSTTAPTAAGVSPKP